MNKLSCSFLFLAFLTLLLNGCSEELDPKPLTYTQLLTGTTSKSWRLTGIQIIEAGREPVSFNVPNDCVYDDLYVFYADEGRTFELKEGASKCNQDDPDVYLTDTWSLINATATLNFVIPIFGGGAYTIKSLTDRTLTVEYYFREDNFSYRFTLTAQQG